MKHLSQQMLGTELRKPYLQRYRRQIQDALRRPGVSAEERQNYQLILDHLGEPKVYSVTDTPTPGALHPGPMPVDIEIDLDGATLETLSSIAHSRLYLYARQEGLEVQPGDTKVQIVKAILATVEGETP